MQSDLNINKLNALTSSEWLLFTKTWFVHKSSLKKDKEIHPASYPDALAEGFIKFFTKPGDWVLDPFAGIGSTQVAAKKLDRNSIGIELYGEFTEFAEERLKKQPGNSINTVYSGDCREVLQELSYKWQNGLDFCITSPPYWCQLSRNDERQKDRKILSLKTEYGDDFRDLSKILDYDEFLNEQEKIFRLIDKIMKIRSYIVVITNNCYRNGRLYPLAFDTFRSLSKIWTPKDEKIWCQDDKKLFPFGMFHSYVGNRSHHYCLIFRKE
jgi:DNA modification methylase